MTEIREKYKTGLFAAYNAKGEVLDAVFADTSAAAHAKIDRKVSERHTVSERFYLSETLEAIATNRLQSP